MININFGFDEGILYDTNNNLILPKHNLNYLGLEYNSTHAEIEQEALSTLGYELDTKNIITEDTIKEWSRHGRWNPMNVYLRSIFRDLFPTKLISDEILQENLQCEIYSLEYLYNNPQISFYYYVEQRRPSIFETHPKDLNLNPQLVECLKRNQCKLLICFVTEGHYMGHWSKTSEEKTIKPYDWPNLMNDILDFYNLPDNSIVLITSNLKGQELTYKLTKRFTVLTQDWFRHSKWVTFDSPNKLLPDFNSHLDIKLSQSFKKHFICMNRILRSHRALFFLEINKNEKLKQTTYLSFSKTTKEEVTKNIMNFGNNYRKSKSKDSTYSYRDSLIDYIQTIDFTENFILDNPDIDKINLAPYLNWPHHRDSFVSLVTETLTDSTTVFFSEKIHKPIIAAQPFIVISSPHFLKYMKKKGYMTFSEFWDESYDDELDYTLRMQKIIELVEEISTWDLKKCHDMYQKMVPILKNNMEVFLDDTEYFELVNHLEKIQKKYNEAV